MFISHTGDICPSGFLELPLGNVRHEPVVDVYRDSRLFRDLREPARFSGRCGECEYHWVCGGSRARAYATTGNPLAEDPLCPYVPSRITAQGSMHKDQCTMLKAECSMLNAKAP